MRNRGSLPKSKKITNGLVTMPWFSLFEIEKSEAVDDTDNRVVNPLLPPGGAKVSVLPNNPACHQQPVEN